MNKELDELLCLLDGKITAYRIKNPYDISHNDSKNNSVNMELLLIQTENQELWKINKEENKNEL